MFKYAIGIDTKDYKLFRSIFSDDVEVNILYTPNYGTDNTVNIKGADNWVNYVDSEISKFQFKAYAIGVGDNAVREKIYRKFSKKLNFESIKWTSLPTAGLAGSVIVTAVEAVSTNIWSPLTAV